MEQTLLHTFHIPVMGLGFTIDTPIKVARYGISSVISIIEDDLVEKVRKHHCQNLNKEFLPIPETTYDYRAKRITAYLNLVKEIVDQQLEELRSLEFEKDNDLTKYFELLPETSPAKKAYTRMLAETNTQAKTDMQLQLKALIAPGSIDVNIMSKLDKPNYSADGEELPVEFCDAMSALRGFAESDLTSSIVFSAGYNPRLYTYLENFKDFFPSADGVFKKKIILKVSDFRSAQIQGKILAKKGIFVSEFRIESGLNCGGHAFPTEGFLLGPILEEFKEKRTALNEELLSTCNNVWRSLDLITAPLSSRILISAQGGIGTANENNLLLDHFGIDSTGWGSPFLLVPEATNVDEKTLGQLSVAKKSDYYLSYASPLGVPFNNFRPSSSQSQRMDRIAKGRPGSPCYKKHLSSDTEFTEKPICTASREYQNNKIKQLKESNPDTVTFKKEYDRITEKDCLCEGLGASVILKNELPLSHKLSAVAICPGPNLAYFSKISSLREMIGHIYGRTNILNGIKRPNIFVNELMLYVEYLKKEMSNYSTFSANQIKYFQKFKNNLLKGIDYYTTQLPIIFFETEKNIIQMAKDLKEVKLSIDDLKIPSEEIILA
jgi:hypothetical protein